MSTIIKHNLHQRTDEGLFDLDFNELALDTETGLIYARNKYGELKIVGDDLRYLTQFPIYDIDKVYSPVNYSFLQFYIKDGAFRLIDRIPNLSLQDLDGYDYTETYTNDYLGVNTSDVFNKNQPVFNLVELIDVKDGNTFKTQANDNKVLTFVAVTNGSLGKDVFTDRLGTTRGYWTLKADSSTIKGFDNVSYVTEQTSQVFISPASGSGNAYLLRNRELDISIDISPELSNFLDCNTKSIYNRPYSTTYISVTEPILALLLDTKSVVVINANNLDYLKINISSFVTVENVVKYYSLILYNFSGVLDLDVKYENGTGLVLEGKTHVLNLAVTYTNAGIDIICLQKATNLR